MTASSSFSDPSMHCREARPPLLRIVPAASILLLVLPVAVGLVGACLPAFGFLPALGRADLSLAPFSDVLATPGIATSMGLSLFTGIAATLISFGIVVLFIAGWRGTPAFAAIERLLSPLLSVPHAAVAFGLAFLIAPSGIVARALSPWLTGWERPPDLLIVHDAYGLTMLAALVLKEIPFLLLMALAALPQVGAARHRRIAASLGYGRIWGFALTTLPPLYGLIRLPVYAVLAYATSVVDVALVLGPTLPPPLAVRVLQWMGDPDLAVRFKAAAGALSQLGLTGTAILFWWLGERAIARIGPHLASFGWRGTRDHALRIVGAAACALTSFVVFAGLAALALWSVAGRWRFPDPLPGTLHFAPWRQAATGLAEPFLNTLIVGGLSVLVALVLVIGSLEYELRRGRSASTRALAILYLPLLVPQIAFLFGLDVALTWVGADATLAALVLVHLVFVFPYVFLSLSGPWRSFDMRYDHVSSTLGHGPVRTFWSVRLPMLSRAVLTAAAVGFAVSVAQYLPTLLIGAGRWPTVTTEAVSLAAGGDRRAIGVTALVQALLPFAGFALALAAPAILFRNRRGMRAG